jgi:hypothetical protein
MDTIEKSNLNRQFLFRATDIRKLKATTAAEAAARMNPALNIKCYRSAARPARSRAGARTLRVFAGARPACLPGPRQGRAPPARPLRKRAAQTLSAAASASPRPCFP